MYSKKTLYEDICANSNVVSGKDYRDLVCAIAEVASDIVVKTLGPYGSTTVIDDGSGFTYPSKDGWTCLSKLQFTDPTYNTIFNMLKKISFNSVTTVGDGTTTAMVAANNFLKTMETKFMPKIGNAGFRQADFIEDMNKIYNMIEEALRNNPNIQQINTDGDYSDIYKIAYIATNGNDEFAKIIQKIYQETKNPNIHVSLEKIPTTISEIQTGYKFDAHTLNFPIYVNDETGIINFKDMPRRVVIFDHNVTFQSHNKIIGSISKLADAEHSEVVIMAPYFDDIICSWIDSSVQNMARNKQLPNIMLIQIPITTNLHKQMLSDICVLANAQIFDDGKVKAFNLLLHNQTHGEDEQIKDDILSLEKYTFESPMAVVTSCMGTIQTIIINKTEAFIQDYENTCNKIQYEAILRDSEDEYKRTKEKALKTIGGTLDRDFLFIQMRYIKLKGSTGVIKVGGLSDIQQHCDKDSLDDAVLACRSAFENGYVRGMNLELLSTIDKLLSNKLDGVYINDILEMLYDCFYLTSLQVMINKLPDNNYKKRVLIKQALNNPNVKTSNNYVTMSYCNTEILDTIIKDSSILDYNLRTEICNPMGEWTVINSAATDIEILRAVVNVLTMVITSNQFLSMTRRFDAKVNDEKLLERRLEEERTVTANKVNSIIDTVVNHPDYDHIQAIIGGINITTDLEGLEELTES